MTTITSAPLPLKLASEYTPAGDQPAAIDALVNGLRNGVARQTLLGVTGSGKTFTIANVIEQTQRPAIIMAPNKTLAAQLYGEMQSFFPDNAVAYFVSYYDYYQPEAYVPASDTHIEKDASINAHIEQMRLAATKALLERPDAIIVASVSAIYGLGDPINYQQLVLRLRVGETVGQRQLLRRLAELQYRRNEVDFFRGYFRVRGDIIEVFPAESEQTALRIELFDDDIDAIHEFDPLTGELLRQYDSVSIHPTTHYVTARERIDHAVTAIRDELAERLDTLRALDKLVEAQRLEQRVRQDLEMLMQLGYCPGIENYSRHLAGLEENEPPYTLLDYLPDNALMIIDESHVAVPQVGAMFRGDRSRKQTLVDYGFRLPSALDNRPLRFEEFEARMPQTIFVSATPGNYEREHSERVVEQLVRPTGLVDPQITIRPAKTQVDDMLAEIRRAVAADERVLITTLTKRMAEDLTDFLFNHGVRVRYLHSDIDTIERIDIIRDLRLGTFDVLVGINLLREGLDMPEVAVVAIFDADKEGFLRSDTSLIQTIGRAARHINGRVLLYADTITGSMQRAMDETERRRNKQLAYNSEHGITPQTIRKAIRSSLRDDDTTGDGQDVASVAVVMTPDKLAKTLKQLEKQMREHANNLEFELAAAVRDQMTALKRVNWQH